MENNTVNISGKSDKQCKMEMICFLFESFFCSTPLISQIQEGEWKLVLSVVPSCIRDLVTLWARELSVHDYNFKLRSIDGIPELEFAK